MSGVAEGRNPLFVILVFAFMIGLFSLFSNLLAQSLYQGLREELTKK